MASDLFLDAGLTALRNLSDDLCKDTCTINQVGGTNNNTPTMGNRGNSTKPITQIFSNIPCRLDAEADRNIPQHDKNGIIGEKLIRTIYIPLSAIQSIGYTPKSEDTIDTAAGNILGQVKNYVIREVPYETDGVDYPLLVEMLV